MVTPTILQNINPFQQIKISGKQAHAISNNRRHFCYK